MIKKPKLLLCFSLIIILMSCTQQKSENLITNFDFNWKFTLGDFPDAYKENFDDSGWRCLELPHDFSIEQPFDSLNPTSTGGGFAYSGIGWYRKHFFIGQKDKNKKHTIIFDGIYRNSEVWINGVKLGERPYGYSSFYYDITPYLKPDGKENIIAVRVNTSEQPNSRWYTGAGIYRHVWLKSTSKTHFEQWGIFAHTIKLNDDKAIININISLKNEAENNRNIKIITYMTDQNGLKVCEKISPLQLNAGDTLTFKNNLELKKPAKWSVENPYLYKLIVELRENNELLDIYKTNYGLRSFRFDPDKGFFLNGEHVKLKGVNNHHDGGPLGAACLTQTHIRQLSLLKEMGCNALRMSHNPPSPELLNTADSLGFLVIDEIFDEWKRAKTPAGYSPHFDDWYQYDIENWIKRDRNHACIIAWSIGNEVPEQWDTVNGPYLAKKIIKCIEKYDTTRPFTSGCNGIPDVNKSELGKILTLVGYNYHEALYNEDHKNFPQRVIFGSETVMYPYQPGDCFQMHSYNEWLNGQKADFVAGEFIWTGFDYLGEAGIGNGGTGCDPWRLWPSWPWHGAVCGMLDICGNKKPGFWFRKALWADEPTVYIAVETDTSAKNYKAVPFWGWPKVENHWNHSKKGDTLAVQVYTNLPQIDLLLNGKSLGKKKFDLQKEAFLIWNVPYEEGKLEAIGYTSEGKTVNNIVQTAGKPAKIKLTAESKTIKANRQDLCYVQAILLDKNDIPVPFITKKIKFSVAGPGLLNSVGNGNQQSTYGFKGDTTETWLGKSLAIIQSGDQKGEIIVKAQCEGLPDSEIKIISE